MSQVMVEKADKALGAILEEIHAPLVATENFKADTSRIVKAFDLSLLSNEKSREITVDLRLPSRKELLKLTLLKMVQDGDKPEGEEVQAVIAAANAALEPFYNGDTAIAWLTRVKHGNTEIIFQGVPHTSSHILNKAYDDISIGTHTTLGIHPNVLKRKFPQATDEEITALNKPDNHHGLVAVNGYPLLNYQEKDINLRGKFAHVVEVVDSLEKVNDTEGLRLHPYVKLGRPAGEATTFAVNNLHQVTTGTTYFGKDALPPEGAVHSALLHENYHVLNGDFTSPSQVMAAGIQQLIPVKGTANACALKPVESAEAFLQAAKGDVEGAKTILSTINNLLDDMQQTLKPTYAALGSKEGVAKLNGRALVADREGGGEMLAFIDKVAENPIPSQSAAQFSQLAKFVVQQGKEKPAGVLPAESVETIRAQMQQTFERHQELFDGINTLQQVGMALNHASEMLADKRALQHMDNPENLIDMLRWASEGKGASLGYSHPHLQEREAAIREWGAELKAQKPAVNTVEKPVIGAATAAVIKRAIQQGSLER